MKLIITILLSITLTSFSFGQTTDITSDQFKKLNSLYEHGVEIIGDSLIISEETMSLLLDEEKRQLIYPSEYNWGQTLQLIQESKLKLAFWNLINLYTQSDYNKDKVVKSILTYNTVLHMDEVLPAVFYSYCYTDPEIGEIVDGRPIVKKPHILEEKLNAVKEIVYYINKYEKNSNS